MINKLRLEPFTAKKYLILTIFIFSVRNKYINLLHIKEYNKKSYNTYKIYYLYVISLKKMLIFKIYVYY